MSELTIAPELALRLQNAAREAGYTNHDLHTLADQTFLTSLLPALIGQGTVVEQCRLKPFTRVRTMNIFPLNVCLKAFR
jgi:hypothetical protein